MSSPRLAAVARLASVGSAPSGQRSATCATASSHAPCSASHAAVMIRGIVMSRPPI